MSTDRVEQFERIIDTIDEQRANQTRGQWVELLQKVKREVDSRLGAALAAEDPFAGILDKEWPEPKP